MTSLDEYKIKDIQVDYCDWQGQKTDNSFSFFFTLGKSKEEENEQKNKTKKQTPCLKK